MKSIAAILLVMLSAVGVRAQVWQVTGATVQLNGSSLADNACFNPPFCILDGQSIDSYNTNAFVIGGLGQDFGVSRGNRASEDALPNFCCGNRSWAHTENFGYAAINGDNTDFITISYGISGRSRGGRDNNYACQATDTLTFTLLLDITGGPFGFPAIVDYSWDHFGGIGGRNEAVTEDACSTIAQLVVDNVGDVFQNRFNFANPPPVGPLPPQFGVFGWNKKTNQGGSLNRNIGDQLVISGRLMLEVNTNNPFPFPAQTLDDQSASQWGRIRLSLGTPIVPVPPDTIVDGSLAWWEFSVDIGGDCEMSDPTIDGNEVFDPGDSYVWQGPALPLGGADGIKNDEIINGFDPFPVAPDGPPAITGAPVASGLPLPVVRDAYFDLDAEDYLDFDLSQFTYGPRNPPIGQFDTPCIFSGENLFASFDDDEASAYVDLLGSAPSNSGSSLGGTYGQTPNRDEVIGLSVFPPAPAAIYFIYPYLSESMLHVSLAPDPLPFAEDLDDDADALDLRDSQCSVWYFSVDHEAAFGLDPGTIYMKVGGGPAIPSVPVIYDSVHLGLLPDVDIDAIEFAWIYDANSGSNGLALLFSVSADDPLTPPDESSSLDPGMIYASYLNGRSFPYLNAPFPEDVDALASWGTPLYSDYVSPPTPCDPPTELVITAEESGGIGTVILQFIANEMASYDIVSTTNASAPPPPGPDWSTVGTLNANAGDVVTYSISYPTLDAVRLYRVITTCP